MVAGLNFVAAGFWAVCAWFIYAGLSAPMTVAVGADQIANLQLMHIQSMNIIIGVGGGIVGSIFSAAGAIAKVLIDAEPARGHDDL